MVQSNMFLSLWKVEANRLDRTGENIFLKKYNRREYNRGGRGSRYLGIYIYNLIHKKNYYFVWLFEQLMDSG